VAVYVKHGEAVSLWNGVAPLHAGDALQLKVQAIGYDHVTIGSPQHDSVRELYRTRAARGGATLLPASFTLDESPGSESLLIVFSRDPLSEAALRDAWHKLPRDRKMWATVLLLRKEGQ